MARCAEGIPGIEEPGRYPGLEAQFNSLYQRILAGVAAWLFDAWYSLGAASHDDIGWGLRFHTEQQISCCSV
ncbi:hypothetical protein MAHJHV63_54940 [Mycobacterium avium subsp. hominissuis]